MKANWAALSSFDARDLHMGLEHYNFAATTRLFLKVEGIKMKR